ncbi:MAG: DUF805 domain-containing protein [Rickettsiaceae bacterium]
MFINIWSNILLYFKKFFKTKGRDGRKVFFIFTIIYYLLNMILDVIIDKSNFFLEYLLIIILFISYFNFTIRRLHDLNISGWMFVFINVILFLIYYYIYETSFFQQYCSIIFWIVTISLIIPLIIVKGTEGPNKYGNPPKY